MTIKSAGFTLVEVLVISPIIILFIGSFIALLVNLTGESLVLREQNVAIYDSQAALDDMQENITKATGFLTSTPASPALPQPQGKNNTTAPFTDTTAGQPDTLILNVPTTTEGPNATGRTMIYTGYGACNTANPIYNFYLIYFVAPDLDTTGDTTDKALFKRTILPTGAACAVPWQRGSCAAADKANSSYSAVCRSTDEKLVGGIATMDVKYHTSATAAGTDTGATTATDVSVSIGVAKKVAGSDINYNTSVRASSLNKVAAAAAPTAPATTASRNPNSPSEPYATTYSWARVGNATGYKLRYTVDGVATEQTVAQTAVGVNPSFKVNAAHRKQAIGAAQAVVVSASGEYNHGTPAPAQTIQNWNECTFQNSWGNYGGPFTTAGYTKTSSKLVGLKGLVSAGTMGQTICTLPVGFRPKFANEKLIFQVATGNGANWGRVDILPTGEIIAAGGSNAWVSLDGIIFVADDSTYTWTVPSGGTAGWQTGWNNYNAVYGGNAHATLRSTTDSQGRRHVQGLGGYSGTAPNGQIMTNIGAGTGPSATLHYPALDGGGPGIIQVQGTNGNIVTRSDPVSWQQLQLIYRPTGASGWQAMPFSGGWQNYNNGWPTLKCHRGSDDVVIVEGLISHPGGGNGIYISNTSPCGRFSSGSGIGVADRLLLSPWMSNETTGRVDFIDGISILSQGTQDPWTALDGIHFIAD